MRIIELKSWPAHFEPIFTGKQTFDIRRNDRLYKTGDRLELKEWNPVSMSYTGRACKADVLSVVHDRDDAFYTRSLAPGHCVLSIKLVQQEKPHGKA